MCPETFFLVLLDEWNAQILADLVGQDVADFGMAGDGGPTVLRRIVLPGMVATLSKTFAQGPSIMRSRGRVHIEQVDVDASWR